MAIRNQKPSFKKKVVGAATMVGALGVLVVYYILTGGQWGGKDFEGQDLRDQGDRFHGADMTQAIFREANISGLDMAGVALHESEMERVIAEETNLHQAVFRRADLRGANFRGAILTEADFSWADLTGADLTGADLRGANLANSRLDDADLRNVMTGSSCENVRFRAIDHCPREGCCEMGWGGTTYIQGTQACRNPFWQIFRDAADAEGFGIVGEPVYFDVIRYDNQRAICVE